MLHDGFARHTPVLTGKRVMRAVLIDSALISHVSEAITELVEASQWVEVGDSVAAITDECWLAVTGWYNDMLVGSVGSFLGTIPDGWLALDGSTYAESDYPELYAFLDAVFKDEILETFTLPDVSGRFLVSVGGTLVMGDTGGLSEVTLTVDEIPPHVHTYTPPVVDIDLELAGAPDVWAARLGPPANTGTTGGGNSHENRPPFLALNYAVFSGRL